MSTAGVWGRWNEGGGQVIIPGVGACSGLPKLGTRPEGSFNRSGSMGGARSKRSRGDPGLPELCLLFLIQINGATGTKRPPCPYAYRCRPRGSAPGTSSALCRQLPRAAMTTRSFLPRRRPG